MTYQLQAIVGLDDLAADAVCRVGRVVELSDRIVMIPLTAAIRQDHAIPLLRFDMDSNLKALPASIDSLCRNLSRGRVVAYIEAAYWGGMGVQAHAICRDGALLGSPVIASDAINQALRRLGVRASERQDEFDTIPLGRFRDTEEWRPPQPQS